MADQRLTLAFGPGDVVFSFGWLSGLSVILPSSGVGVLPGKRLSATCDCSRNLCLQRLLVAIIGNPHEHPHWVEAWRLARAHDRCKTDTHACMHARTHAHANTHAHALRCKADTSALRRQMAAVVRTRATAACSCTLISPTQICLQPPPATLPMPTRHLAILKQGHNCRLRSLRSWTMGVGRYESQDLGLVKELKGLEGRGGGGVYFQQ